MGKYNPFAEPPSYPNQGESLDTAKGVAQSQQGYNTTAGTASQHGSMIGNQNPFGSLSWLADPNAPGGYTANVSLSPSQQGLFNTYTGTQGIAGGAGQSLISGANYGSQSPATAIGDMNSGLTQQLLGQQTASLDPFFRYKRDSEDARLRNQGLFPGSPGYDRAMLNLDKAQGVTISDFLAKTTPQTMDIARNLYQMPWLMGKDMAQFGGATMPNSAFVETPDLNIQPANLVGAYSAANAAEKNRFDAEQAQYNARMAGLWAIPTAIAGGAGKAAGASMGGFGGGTPAAAPVGAGIPGWGGA